MPASVEKILNSQYVQLALAALAFLIALWFVVVIARMLMGGRLRLPGGRTRQARLGIVDAFDLDRQRQLIIVRRDNTEHLIMIGGPNDLLIESEIVRMEGREGRRDEGRREEGRREEGRPAPRLGLEPTASGGQRPDDALLLANTAAPPPLGVPAGFDEADEPPRVPTFPLPARRPTAPASPAPMSPAPMSPAPMSPAPMSPTPMSPERRPPPERTARPVEPAMVDGPAMQGVPADVAATIEPQPVPPPFAMPVPPQPISTQPVPAQPAAPQQVAPPPAPPADGIPQQPAVPARPMPPLLSPADRPVPTRPSPFLKPLPPRPPLRPLKRVTPQAAPPVASPAAAETAPAPEPHPAAQRPPETQGAQPPAGAPAGATPVVPEPAPIEPAAAKDGLESLEEEMAKLLGR